MVRVGTDNIFVERLWRSIVRGGAESWSPRPELGLPTWSPTTGRGLTRLWATGPQQRCGQEARGAAAEEAGLPSGLVKPSAGVGDSLNLALVLS